MRGDPCRVKAKVMKAAFGRAAHAHHGLNPENIGRQQVAPAGVDRLRHAHRAGECARRGMHNGADVGIVVIKAMHQRPVHQHGVAKRQLVRQSNQAAGAAAGNTAYAG